MLKSSLRVAFVGLMVSLAFAACGNDEKEPVVAPPTPTPTPTPTPAPTSFTFGNACSGQEGECGADGACLTFGEGGTVGMCSGACREESQTSDAEIEASWTLCADNQTGNLGATAACVAGNGEGQIFCAAICGTLTTIATGEVTDFGTCDAQFVCQVGAFNSNETSDLSQLGVCG